MRTGEGVDRGERISDPGEIRKRRGVNREEFCSSGIKGAGSAKYKLFTLVEDRIGSSKSFQAQIARFRFSPDSGQIAASRRPATKSADARRGAADDGEIRQVAKPTGSKGVGYKPDTSHRRGKCLS